MKTDNFRSVYRMSRILSMGGHRQKQAGYLLIELMIALATLAVCSLLVARLQVYMVCHSHDAEQYLKAVTYASRAFEERSFGVREQDGFTITATAHCAYKKVPYKQITVVVAWQSMAGVQKQITIQGGMLDESENA